MRRDFGHFSLSSPIAELAYELEPSLVILSRGLASAQLVIYI
jgi:hypothetical protein